VEVKHKFAILSLVVLLFLGYLFPEDYLKEQGAQAAIRHETNSIQISSGIGWSGEFIKCDPREISALSKDSFQSQSLASRPASSKGHLKKTGF